MGTLANGEVVAPFANAAMRLLREDWKGKYGSKMLAEELFPILQTGIPNPDQNFQNFITINAGDDGAFAAMIDKFGNKLFEITAADGLKPIEPPGYPPPKLKPRIVWAAKTINAGDSIDAGELDAVAVDPETGAEVDGVYVYDPVSGTTFASAGTATLYVNFTPTDGVKYRRSMGSTVLTVVGSVLLEPVITWPPIADIWLGTALSGTQLNAVATDPITSDPVAGVFVYTPPSATVLDIGETEILAEFTPTDTLTYIDTAIANLIVVKGIYGIAHGTPGPFTVQVGDLIVIAAGITDASSGATVIISDDGGNTYTQIGGYIRSDDGVDFLSMSMWYLICPSSATLNVTVTPSGGSGTLGGSAQFRGVLALDGSSSGSGSGGETQTAGTCPVSADRELVVMAVNWPGTGFAAKSQWVTSGRINIYANVTQLLGQGGTAPQGGANTAVDPVAAGTATTPWQVIAASFTHRTS